VDQTREGGSLLQGTARDQTVEKQEAKTKETRVGNWQPGVARSGQKTRSRSQKNVAEIGGETSRARGIKKLTQTKKRLMKVATPITFRLSGKDIVLSLPWYGLRKRLWGVCSRTLLDRCEGNRRNKRIVKLRGEHTCSTRGDCFKGGGEKGYKNNRLR